MTRSFSTQFMRNIKTLIVGIILFAFPLSVYAQSTGDIHYNETPEAIEYYNGTQWVHAGLGSYVPNAVNFDGATHLTHNGTIGSTSSTSWSGSFWIKRNDLTNSQVILDSSGAANASITLDVVGELRFIAQNTAGTEVLNIDTDRALNNISWNHVVFSFDLTNTANRHVYINGVSVIENVVTYNTAETMNFAGPQYGIGNRFTSVAGEELVAGLSDFWIDFNAYIDFSLAENRERFIAPSTLPMYLGPDGSIPLGQSPDIFLSGGTDDWHINNGTGAGFIENGTLTNTITRPGIIDSNRTWRQVGNNLSGFGSGFPTITTLTSDTIAYIDTANDDLRTYSWDGTNWSLVGNELNIPNGTRNAIESLDASTVAYYDSNNDDLRTYSWDGTNWSQIGNNLNIPGPSSVTMAALDSNTIAFINSGTSVNLTTYSWDGTNWSQVGNQLSITNVFDPTLTTIDTNTIALARTATSNNLVTYEWDGTNWSQVGNSLQIISINQAELTTLELNKVAYIDNNNRDLRTYRWDGVNWFLVGNELNIFQSFSGLYGIEALDSNTIAYTDSANQDLRTYEFVNITPCGDAANKRGNVIYNSDDKVMQYCNDTDWVAMGPIGGTGGTSCTVPTGNAGDIIFNSLVNTLQFCNSEDWVTIGQ